MNIGKPVHLLIIFILCLASFLFQYCAPTVRKQPFRPFAHQKIDSLISMGREQERKVHALFSLGHLTMIRQGSEVEMEFLIAGLRDSGKIKIEITHPWGRPVLHILINKACFKSVSFRERRYYDGKLGAIDATGFLPGRLGPDQIWPLVRAYPVIREYHRVIILKDNQIAILNINNEKVQFFDFFHQMGDPCLMTFPRNDVKVSFSSFQNINGIYYARKVGLNDPKTGSLLTLHLKQIVFNKVIPERVFELEKPVGFEHMSLQ